WNAAVRAIEGAEGVQRLVVEDLATGAREPMAVSGVFIYAGLTPNTELLGGLVPLAETGQIVTDLEMRTAVPGILAAGRRPAAAPSRPPSARLLAAGAGAGAAAAMAAVRYLRTGAWR